MFYNNYTLIKICNKIVLSKLLFYLKKLTRYDLGDQYGIDISYPVLYRDINIFKTYNILIFHSRPFKLINVYFHLHGKTY